MKKTMYLLVLTVLFSCNVNNEPEPVNSLDLSLEEFRNEIRNARAKAYKEYLSSQAGQETLNKLARGSKDEVKSDAENCNCLYTIEEVVVDETPADEYLYEFWSTEGCSENPFDCNYFSAIHSTIFPECIDIINDACVDTLDNTFPVWSEPFDCQVPAYGTFDVNFAAVGTNLSCGPILIGASHITFKIKCCDMPVEPGADINHCGNPNRCYSTQSITIALDGEWDTEDGINIELEGCGCEPQVM